MKDRTTIKLRSEHRKRLKALAERRGEKGFSGIIAEALDGYFRTSARRKKAIAEALSAGGSLTEAEAEELRESVRKAREGWD